MPFQKGHKLSPGRKVGQINKATANVKAVFVEVFALMQGDANANLLAWGINNPTEFYRLAARLIPYQAEVTISKLTTIIDISGEGISIDSEASGSDQDSE